MSVLPGDVYQADVFEGGVRPVVIVSRPELNQGDLYLVVPITASRVQERRKYANYVYLAGGHGGLPSDSVAVAHLIQPLRSDFLRVHLGRLSDMQLQDVLLAIAWSIQLFD